VRIISVILVFAIFITFYLAQPVHVRRIVYIPKVNLTQVITSLQHQNVDIVNLDKYILYILGNVQSGWIDLKSTTLTKLDLLYKLTHSKAALKKITIIPGETDYFIYKKIAKTMHFRDLTCAIPTGFLYADTYYIPYGFSKQRLCSYLYNISLKRHKAISNKIFGMWNFDKYYHYLIIASIIQKEAKNKYDMKLISSVIYNRLKRHMRLQMDGTLNYGQFSHTKVTPYMIKHDTSHFNTYKYFGLPPKPICVASLDAILAAIFPAKTNYLYFVKVGNKHVFSTTYKQHLKNVKK